MDTPSIKIFVVDDDAPVRKALSRLLRAHGYVVYSFPSAQEFLTHVSPEVDVKGCLILDVKMPGMNGLDLQAKINTFGWELPIIFMSAYDEPEYSAKALANGAVDFLPKPLNEKELLTSLRSVIKVKP